MRRLAAVLVALVAAVPLLAQQPVPPVRRDTVPRAGARSPNDTAARDTTPKELVKWAESDPVLDSLLNKPGYSVTRFQGRTITFDARQKQLTLIRDDSARAAIGRDRTLMVSDTIVYDDSTKVVRARGAENVLRDPSRGGDDVVSRGTMYYNTTERRGTVGFVRTTIESGQKYFVDAERAGFANDSLGVEAAFFGRGGSITTCDDSLPHYHFSSRELKLVKGKIAVGRPGVLYVYDVPVFWLPFYFQDVRSGRRSGMLSPNLGLSEIVRNGPLYRRNIENLGWYFNLDDYQDVQAWVDWRSSANIDPRNAGDFGFTKYNLQWRYNWLRRFLNGSAGMSYQRLSSGDRNFNLQLSHQQRFSRRTSFNANINYVTNAIVQRTTAFNPAASMATFRSSANYQTGVGPFAIAVGGSQTQYVGRKQVDRAVPNVSVTTAPITVGDWLTWTPNFRFDEQRTNNQQGNGQATWRFGTNPQTGLPDSTELPLNTRRTSLSFDTPLQLWGFSLQNSLEVTDEANTGTTPKTIEQITDRGNGVIDTTYAVRYFNGFTQTNLDWRFSFNLPSFSRGKWNVSPSVQFANVDPGPFWIRSSLSGGKFVAQSKRPSFNLAISPTLFGFFPGVGPVTRIRHSIQPSLSWSIAPRSTVNSEYLRAINRYAKGYNGALPQNVLTLALTQNVEVKLRAPADSAPEAGRKVRALSIQTDAISYNFLQLRELRERFPDRKISKFAGLTSSNWGMGLRSDFLPGFDVSTRYSLFQGNPISDTAVFKPYREEIRASLRLDRTTGVIQWINRFFGGSEFKAQRSNMTASDSMIARNDSAMRGMNQGLRSNQVRPQYGAIPSGQGWSVNLSYSSTRQRPPVGANGIVQPPVEERCALLLQGNTNPFLVQDCINRNGIYPGVDNSSFYTGLGSPIIISPPLRSLQVQTSFNITPKWATQYSTTYDAVRGQFAAQTVSLQRELHDWRAIFNFTQSPNGNFAFSFFISLKAQPDLKFDFNQQTFRNPSSSSSR